SQLRSVRNLRRLRWMTNRATRWSCSLLKDFLTLYQRIQACIQVRILPSRSSRISSRRPNTPARKKICPSERLVERIAKNGREGRRGENGSSLGKEREGKDVDMQTAGS